MHMCVLVGGKDGLVGFPDFIYKNIVPACFLAPLKPTFDLSDAQTVLVSSAPEISPPRVHCDVPGFTAH